MRDQMEDRQPSGDHISATISGPVSGMIAVGRQNYQARTEVAPAVTDSELRQLREALARLQARVAAEAPGETRDEALAQVADLEQAVLAGKPDISTMRRVRDWFVDRLPALAGVVGSLVVHPIVGALAQAAGETVAEDFRRRLSQH